MFGHSFALTASGNVREAKANAVPFILILTLFIAAASLSATHKDVTRGFDELAHVSYIAQIQYDHTVAPDLSDLRLLDPKTFRFTTEANYLNHPPFYYVALAELGPEVENHPEVLIFYRLINVALGALGLAMMMALGLLARFERLALYAYWILLASIPVLAPLAGAVNNDNAAIAGGGLAMLAGWKLIASPRLHWLALMLTGVVLASFAKLTGLLLVGSFALAVFAYLVWRERAKLWWSIPIAFALVLAAAPYLYFIAIYGSPAPATQAQTAMLISGSHLAGWSSTRLSFPDYFIRFTAQLIEQWMPSLVSRNNFQYAMLVIPVIFVFTGFLGLVQALRHQMKSREAPIDVMIIAGAFALIITLICHLAFSYDHHLATGWLLDAQPRYYLPLAAIIPLGCLSLLSADIPQRIRNYLLALFLAGPLVFRLLGGPLGL
jgi:hypothetical protein